MLRIKVNKTMILLTLPLLTFLIILARLSRLLSYEKLYWRNYRARSMHTEKMSKGLFCFVAFVL